MKLFYSPNDDKFNKLTKYAFSFVRSTKLPKCNFIWSLFLRTYFLCNILSKEHNHFNWFCLKLHCTNEEKWIKLGVKINSLGQCLEGDFSFFWASETASLNIIVRICHFNFLRWWAIKWNSPVWHISHKLWTTYFRIYHWMARGKK